MKPIDLKCYQQVAAVIGEAYADYELQRVIDCEECSICNEENLFDSFAWDDSPQKDHFWCRIYHGENPYEHGHEKPELKVNIFEKALDDGLTMTELGEGVPESETGDIESPVEQFKRLRKDKGPEVAHYLTFGEESSKERSDGSTASYYELPEGATELQHLISHRNLNAQLGEIFRACYRYGLVSHSDMLRDAKKIKFYAQAEIERLEKLAQSDK